MKQTIFKGSGVAIITPMLEDGSVNYPVLKELLEQQIAGGTDAIVICGTTGEASALNDTEHLDVIEFACATVNRRLPVIAGTGSNDTRHAVALSREAKNRGADALLQVTPYYNKTSQAVVIQQQIELARQQADIVVVGVHWGVEGSHTPTDAQRALGQKIADWGADVIIGTHPHVIQPVELLTAAGTGKTVPIAYSLGNFVSTQAAANNMVGVILTFDITKTTQPDGSASASVGNVHAVPMVMHYDSNYTNARAYLYRDYTEELAAAHGVRARFSGFSKEYITQLLTEYISPEFLVLE